MAWKQTSFASTEFAAKKRVTRHERFLADGQVVLWAALKTTCAPVYPTGIHGGPPINLSQLLRDYFIPQPDRLFREAVEGAIYSKGAVHMFVSVNLARETAPDATAMLKFQCLFKTNDLTQWMSVANNDILTKTCIAEAAKQAKVKKAIRRCHAPAF